MARIDAAIAERARQQLGLITFQQLEALGCTRAMRRRRVDAGELLPAGHRVLRARAHPSSWEQRLLAAALDAGDGAVVSHLSAARCWGFSGIGEGAIELSTTADRRPRLEAGRLHRVSALDPCDVCSRAPFTLTTAERTLVDIGPRLRSRQLEQVLDAAARAGILTVESTRATLERLQRQGRPGPAALRRVLGDPLARTRTDSWLERRTLQVLRAAGLPLPRTQVHPAGADRSTRVDFIYDHHRLVVEVDGHATHSTRRQRQHDAEREADLVASGWRVVRFTYEDVTERPDYVVATIRRLLDLWT